MVVEERRRGYDDKASDGDMKTSSLPCCVTVTTARRWRHSKQDCFENGNPQEGNEHKLDR